METLTSGLNYDTWSKCFSFPSILTQTCNESHLAYTVHTFPFLPHKMQNLRTQNPQWWCLGHCVMSDSFATPWPVAFQASWSMGFPRQEYWSGLLFPSLGDLPDPGIKPGSPAVPAWQMDSLPLSHQGCPSELRWMPNYCNLIIYSFSSFFLFSWFLSFYFALFFLFHWIYLKLL